LRKSKELLNKIKTEKAYSVLLGKASNYIEAMCGGHKHTIFVAPNGKLSLLDHDKKEIPTKEETKELVDNILWNPKQLLKCPKCIQILLCLRMSNRVYARKSIPFYLENNELKLNMRGLRRFKIPPVLYPAFEKTKNRRLARESRSEGSLPSIITMSYNIDIREARLLLIRSFRDLGKNLALEHLSELVHHTSWKIDLTDPKTRVLGEIGRNKKEILHFYNTFKNRQYLITNPNTNQQEILISYRKYDTKNNLLILELLDPQSGGFEILKLTGSSLPKSPR